MDDRAYPTRPFLAASAAVMRDGRVLIVRRGGNFGRGIYTLPGGVVEAGETLTEAVIREVREETQVAIEPVALAGYREMIMRDDDGKTARHFVIVCFAARWVAGEPVPDITEIAEAAWRLPEELDGLKTTEGLREIVGEAIGKL
jgi:ADP-ribose pyrophosphatase YjhB (NUDIX family)